MKKAKKVSIASTSVESGSAFVPHQPYISPRGPDITLQGILSENKAFSRPGQSSSVPIKKSTSVENVLAPLDEEVESWEGSGGDLSSRTSSPSQSLVSWDLEDHIGIRLLRSGFAGMLDLGVSRENSALSEER